MAKSDFVRGWMLTGIASAVVAGSIGFAGLAFGQTFGGPRDPGVRGGAPGAGGALPGLTTAEGEAFTDGLEDFNEAEGVGDGLGPRFNLDGCGGCHAQPATGGTSPRADIPIGGKSFPNPQVAVATALGANNVVPSFIRANGPVREARFQQNPDGSPDGGVHALFVISGRKDTTGDARGCTAVQEDFEKQVANRNIIFRIPTPVFGAGLIEMINDATLAANLAANSFTKSNFGIKGRLNRNGNDGTVTRFGWKAQNKSLLIFSGEAYNVEMGITNELFQQERDENPTCQFAKVPNDTQDLSNANGTTSVFPGPTQAIENFANFQRFSNQPTPVTASFTTKDGNFVSSTSIARGKQRFVDIGCALCHTPSLTTNANTTVGALSNKTANLYSDVALHNMGPGLADEISQGVAAGDEFRTAPLWGVGQRIFFLHDGRTDDLKDAIRAHRSAGNTKFGPSEANKVIDNFDALGDSSTQDLLNFLRSL
jgi:CxxC motif-containing protein (DUF1111 family)